VHGRYRHRVIDQVGHETTFASKLLFTDRYTWQNFRLQFLHLVNRLCTVIHKTQKLYTKVLSCVTVGEFFVNLVGLTVTLFS
jgi:hypothetical protein